MRVISGKARGTKLYTLEGLETRPTLDRVKESVFNIIQNDIQQSVFLDVFSGSGAIGIEAASRGAKKVIMFENSKEAIQIIRKNIEKTHLEKQIVLYQGDYEKLLDSKLQEKPDIVYIDPPYKTEYVIKTVQILLKKQLLKPNTILIIETDIEEQIIKQLKEIKQIQINKQKKYGRISIIIINLNEPN